MFNHHFEGGFFMISESTKFHEYFLEWIKLYKEGAVREITLKKYYTSHLFITQIAPNLLLSELSRQSYQSILNEYASTHEKQTTKDFHHQLKSSIRDAVDEKIIAHDPTRKVVIKGKKPRDKKQKYLSQFELQKLLDILDLGNEINLDWMILLMAKTGIRFSEALGLTPEDFDFHNHSITINKSWDYRSEQGGFQETKNKSSIRKVPIDWKTCMQFSHLIQEKKENQPIFITGRIYNSTVNHRLKRYCQKANIPVISAHGLRHTHASLLLFAGVSIATVARRLGHANMTTTQQVYLHIIQELENQDNDKVMRYLSSI